MRTQERMHFIRGTDEHIRIKKESNMFQAVSQQTPKMDKGERN
jgi:hypothetical protein